MSAGLLEAALAEAALAINGQRAAYTGPRGDRDEVLVSPDSAGPLAELAVGTWLRRVLADWTITGRHLMTPNSLAVLPEPLANLITLILEERDTL